ncbi:hypothetical protein R3X27_23400 [Tropicimonas sp. TH_r6]|nr:hypothetical protein [Tropicimonas sp. TH_r6]MDV7145640.1 hypothetical protein [Tropicimonas sp. TH_r6]
MPKTDFEKLVEICATWAERLRPEVWPIDVPVTEAKSVDPGASA